MRPQCGSGLDPLMSCAPGFLKVVVGGSPAARLLEGCPAERGHRLGLGGLQLQVVCPASAPRCPVDDGTNICLIKGSSGQAQS